MAKSMWTLSTVCAPCNMFTVKVKVGHRLRACFTFWGVICRQQKLIRVCVCVCVCVVCVCVCVCVCVVCMCVCVCVCVWCVCVGGCVCPADVSMCAGSGSLDQRLPEHRPDPDSPHQVSPTQTNRVQVTQSDQRIQSPDGRGASRSQSASHEPAHLTKSSHCLPAPYPTSLSLCVFESL